MKRRDRRAKPPPLLLRKTYQGTYHTLMKNCGFPEEEAKSIEANFKDLYKVSIDWVQDKLKEASEIGHVTLAFGLRLRTPLLHQIMFGRSGVPFQAEAEGRTAGNAVSGQSYGLLTNRALMQFMERVRSSVHRNHIKPIAMIHDAIYLVIWDSLEVIEWVNTNLIECMQWQELPELKHDQIKLGAELEIYFPSWATPMKIPNKANTSVIQTMGVNHLGNLKEKSAA